MADTSSLPGGNGIVTHITPNDRATGLSVIQSLQGGSGFSNIVYNSLSTPPDPSGGTVYNILNPTEGETDTLPTGGGALVEAGTADVTLVGNGAAGTVAHPGEILVGNSANDTFDVTGGTAAVVTGNGSNTINASNATIVLYDGDGDDTVNMGKNTSIVEKGPGTVTINGQPGSYGWYTSDTGGTVNLGSGTALSLGTGNDTVNALGSATVLGGYDSTIFHGGTDSTFLAGQGNETLYGGSGATTFVGSNTALGTDFMVGGSGTNVFVGGNNRDTMTSGASLGASSDLFEFTASVSGGNHTILGYTPGKDAIDLDGYTSANVTEAVVGGNTVITLSDGTVITVNGVTDPSTINLVESGANLPAGTFNPNLPSGQGSVPTSAATYTLGGTDGTSKLLAGTAAMTVTGGSATGQTFVGNNGADTFNLGTGGGIVATGSGNDTINTVGGKVDVNTGAGANVINDHNTDLTLYGSGDDTVNVIGTDNYLSALGAHVNLANGSAILLGTGDDTVTALGAATVSGGYNNVIFHGGTDSTVYAGSGIETLFGGTGATNFYGSTVANAYDSMVGGSGTNFFQGGVSTDTMVSGASIGASSDIFDFASSVSGGNHTIQGFNSAKDVVQLQGYTATDVQSVTTTAGSSVISLDDGTLITLKGVASFTAGQIHYT